MASPPPVFGDLTALTGLLPPPPPSGAALPSPLTPPPRPVLLDLASNSLIVSFTRSFGRAGTFGFTGDFFDVVFFPSGAAPASDADLWAEPDREARTDSFSSRRLGSEMGRGMRDLLDLLVREDSVEPGRLLVSEPVTEPRVVGPAALVKTEEAWNKQNCHLIY